jgi:hypothetical protein
VTTTYIHVEGKSSCLHLSTYVHLNYICIHLILLTTIFYYSKGLIAPY